MMNHEQFVDLVAQMREHQKAFFRKTGDHDYHLMMSKKLEHEVDSTIAEYKGGQGDLFQDDTKQGNSPGWSFKTYQSVTRWRMNLSGFIHGAGTIDDVVLVRKEMTDWLQGNMDKEACENPSKNEV